MSFKMVTCVICENEVSKVSTLSLRALGEDRDGRACREHPEVIEFQERQREKERQERDMAHADEAVNVLMGVAGVRMAHTMYGISLDTLYFRLQARGFSEPTIKKVQAEVESLGPRLSEEEMRQAIFSAANLMMRQPAP